VARVVGLVGAVDLRVLAPVMSTVRERELAVVVEEDAAREDVTEDQTG
jgi:hypothetical protein